MPKTTTTKKAKPSKRKVVIKAKAATKTTTTKTSKLTTNKKLIATAKTKKAKPTIKSSIKTKNAKAKVQPIPKGYASITPYLIVKGAEKALDFYKRGLGAKEIMRHAEPNGKIMHAEIKIGDSIIMLADEFPEMQCNSPHTVGGSPVMIHLYVKNVDKLYQQAIMAGAKEQWPVKDQFYGDRSGGIIDPFGHIWHISTHIEDLSKKEIQRRAAEFKF